MARTCGDCSLCCRLMGIAELNKPVNQWCPHCAVLDKPSRAGCKIYESRPPSCAGFQCMWLMEENIPDSLRPDKCGVLFFYPDPNERGAETLDAIHAKCDPKRPDAWRAPMVEKLITAATAGGYDVILSIGDRRKLLTNNPETAQKFRDKLIQIQEGK